MARRARANDVLLAEIRRVYPVRDTSSDGWIGDAAHRSRPSDHNPDEYGVVQAIDVDEDRDGPGGLGARLWEFLRTSRDPRISYVIYERRMFSSYPARGYPAWTVRPYDGSNGHLGHLHLSLVDDPAGYDDPSPWGFATEEDDVYVVRYGQGPDDLRVRRVQKVVHAACGRAGIGEVLGRSRKADGSFDGHYGADTAAAVNALARRAGLPEDGGTGMDVLVLDYARNWLDD